MRGGGILLGVVAGAVLGIYIGVNSVTYGSDLSHWWPWGGDLRGNTRTVTVRDGNTAMAVVDAQVLKPAFDESIRPVAEEQAALRKDMQDLAEQMRQVGQRIDGQNRRIDQWISRPIEVELDTTGLIEELRRNPIVIQQSAPPEPSPTPPQTVPPGPQGSLIDEQIVDHKIAAAKVEIDSQFDQIHGQIASLNGLSTQVAANTTAIGELTPRVDTWEKTTRQLVVGSYLLNTRVGTLEALPRGRAELLQSVCREDYLEDHVSDDVETMSPEDFSELILNCASKGDEYVELPPEETFPLDGDSMVYHGDEFGSLGFTPPLPHLRPHETYPPVQTVDCPYTPYDSWDNVAAALSGVPPCPAVQQLTEEDQAELSRIVGLVQ